MQTLILNGEKKTNELGKLISNSLNDIIANGASLVIFLNGNLGAGKTTLVRSIVRSLGYNGKVKSPSYSLVEEYNNLKNINEFFHFDLYRLEDPEELEFLGIREYLSKPSSISVIEWPDKGEGFLPSPDLIIELSILENKREFNIFAKSESGDKAVHAMEQNISNYDFT